MEGDRTGDTIILAKSITVKLTVVPEVTIGPGEPAPAPSPAGPRP